MNWWVGVMNWWIGMVNWWIGVMNWWVGVMNWWVGEMDWWIGVESDLWRRAWNMNHRLRTRIKLGWRRFELTLVRGRNQGRH